MVGKVPGEFESVLGSVRSLHSNARRCRSPAHDDLVKESDLIGLVTEIRLNTPSQ